jgi:hypothetical protein
VIKEELPPLMDLISNDILSKKMLHKPGSYAQYLQSYVTIWIISKFQF